LSSTDKVFLGRYWWFSFFITDNWCRYFCITQTTAVRHYTAFLSSGHINKKSIIQVTTMKKQIAISYTLRGGIRYIRTSISA